MATRFEMKGVELQEFAETIDQAKRLFRYSCTLCAQRGSRVECDRCAIQYAHELKVDLLHSMELERMQKESDERRRRFGLEPAAKIIIVL